MAIDATVPNSPGWWMQRLARQLEAKQKRLARLDAYYRGRPPLAHGTLDQRSAFYRFQQTSRSNFAALVVQAPCERLAVRSIKTKVDKDASGDQAAWKLYTANDLDIDSAEVDRMAWTFGEGYYIVGAPESEGEPAIITAEDPRQVITASSPLRPRKTIAAFKLFHDDTVSMDFAYLWLPGEMWVAKRPRKARATDYGQPIPVSFSIGAYDWAPFKDDVDAAFDVEDDDFPAGPFSERFDVKDVPVQRVTNRGGVGEFELHTDLLDRINHMLLQRIVIATLQAFRQRALELGADEEDLDTVDPATGEKIDYDDLFAADPGALWRLPKGAKIWESGQVDLTGILSAVKDDVLHLAAVTRTPLVMFTPDAATQTAEGASLQREGLVFKVEDYQRTAGRALANVISIAFKFMGDEERADLSELSIDWQPAERFSLSERANADAQSTLPFEDKLRVIYQMTPAEIGLAKTNRADDLVYAQQLAAIQAASAAAAGGDSGA